MKLYFDKGESRRRFLGSLEEAIENYPPDKFTQSRAREAYELRKRLLDVLGLTEPET